MVVNSISGALERAPKVASIWVRCCPPQSSNHSLRTFPRGCKQCELYLCKAKAYSANSRKDIQKGYYQRKAPAEAVWQVVDGPQKLKSGAGERGRSTLQTPGSIGS